MRRTGLFLILLAGIAFLPTFSAGQGPGGKGGGGFKMPTPDESFNTLANGKEVIVVSELDDRAKRWFSKMGITGDRVTRDQFKVASEKMMAQFQQNGFGKMGGPNQTGDNNSGGKDRRGDPDTRAEESFKRADRNNDGLLSFEEMSETLQKERDTYDTNKDGFIDLAEYKVYYAAMRAPKKDNTQPEDPAKADEKKTTENNAPAPDTHQGYKEEARPTIFRSGNLPKNLPEWFVRLDKEGDNDGQVGLYEWKTLGRPIEEFTAMDLNGDGLLTVEEYFRWKASPAGKKAEGDQVASEGSTSEDRMPSRSTSQNGDGNGSPRFGGNNNGNRFGGGFGPPMGGGNNGGNRFGGFAPPKGGDNNGGGMRFGGPKGGDNSGGSRFGPKGGDNSKNGDNAPTRKKGGNLSNN